MLRALFGDGLGDCLGAMAFAAVVVLIAMKIQVKMKTLVKPAGKYYGVRGGANAGVYQSWAEASLASQGIAGALVKKGSFEEATFFVTLKKHLA